MRRNGVYSSATAKKDTEGCAEVLTLTAPWANPKRDEWESSYSAEFLCASTIASPDVEAFWKGGHCL